MKVTELMSEPVHTVPSGLGISAVARRMEELKVGSLLVEEQGQIVGILTSRDIRSSHPNRIAADAMTPGIIRIPDDQFIWDAQKMMEEHNIERLVVTHQDKVRGILTREAVNVRLSRVIDPLTGLYRTDYIRHLTDYFLEQKRPFQFLFIDLDNFGEINKQYGHPVGDDFLQMFSARLTDMKQDHLDYICRYAGDEFIFLTLRSKQEAIQIMEKIAEPLEMNQIQLHATVGPFFVSRLADMSGLTFREVLHRSSLLCSHTKQQIC